MVLEDEDTTKLLEDAIAAEAFNLSRHLPSIKKGTRHPEPLDPRLTDSFENGSPEIRTQDQPVKSRMLYR